jgi:hypothetical protein
MSTLYDTGQIHMPNGEKITIQGAIDILTLKNLTPDIISWIHLMVRDQLRNDCACAVIEIEPGCVDYVYRQILHYAIDALMEYARVVE